MKNSSKVIFFGCSMRGGYSQMSKDKLAQFPVIIQELGHKLASQHQTRDWKTEEAPLSATQIHDRDYDWLIGSNAGIFEISNPSLGVGGEISDLIHLGKPVLCLYKKGLEEQISAYIRGKKGSRHISFPFEAYAYSTISEAKTIIKKFLDLYA